MNEEASSRVLADPKPRVSRSFQLRRLADFDHVFLFRPFAQGFQAFGLLAEAHDILAQPGGVLGQVLQQHHRLVIGVIDSGHDRRQQQRNGDKRSQAAGQVQP